MLVLVLNCGSSSLRFSLVSFRGFETGIDPNAARVISRGTVSGIGGRAALHLVANGASPHRLERDVRDHAGAVPWVFEILGGSQVEAVGHRVVHGGDRFVAPVMVDSSVLAEIERLGELAPLHNPACLAGIQASQAFLGSSVPMVAVFDTAFHRTLPEYAAAYAIPSELAARHQIRRYGFHGIAHASLAAGFATAAGTALDQVRLITLHLGNGCSAAAIQAGRSVETSMGFTPLEGLVMGTRSGDLDPSLIGHLARREGVAVDRVEQWLNERSGLLGLSGVSHDMREVLAQADRNPRAAFAIEVFCHRVRKYLGAYLAILGGADAVVFGGGIGEHAPAIRARICQGMEWCGIRLDPERNNQVGELPPGTAVCISRSDATLPVYVAAVDEETWIARETVRCLTFTEGAEP